ncbi:MAG TPA: zinc ribbon domain-containing protein [Ktedonobacteraceae bacterium]|jgi:putative FmdB family regulatory protein|nr:zinc ribbon domain-containing protein [Ktedonobacteraceae bacterium]
MPLYEFQCDSCGSFTHWRAFAQASEAMICPTCQRVVRRLYTPPGLYRVPAELAKARYRAEKSAFEPEIVRRQRPASGEKEQAKPFQQSHGRPWQLEH